MKAVQLLHEAQPSRKVCENTYLGNEGKLSSNGVVF